MFTIKGLTLPVATSRQCPYKQVNLLIEEKYVEEFTH